MSRRLMRGAPRRRSAPWHRPQPFVYFRLLVFRTEPQKATVDSSGTSTRPQTPQPVGYAFQDITKLGVISPTYHVGQILHVPTMRLPPVHYRQTRAPCRARSHCDRRACRGRPRRAGPVRRNCVPSSCLRFAPCELAGSQRPPWRFPSTPGLQQLSHHTTDLI